MSTPRSGRASDASAVDPADDADKRRYDGSGRQRDAQRRRRRMLDAAHELFLEQGFGATSVEQIAQRAGTSAQTVYAAFGNKPGVLRRVIDVAVAGDDEDVKVIERPAVAAIIVHPDLPTRLRLMAEFAAAAHRRSGELVHLVERVSGADPAVAELAADLRIQLRADTERMVEALPADERRTDLTVERLADVAVLLVEARTWYSLVIERGWSDQQYVDWLADAIRRNLLVER